MRVLNADGSEAEMCGNGIRCVAKVLYEGDPALRKPVLAIDTGAGLLACEMKATDGHVESVTVEMVVANLTRNVANAKRIIRTLADRLPADRTGSTCGCASALANAIMTDRSLISMPLREKYGLLINKYLEA